MDSPAPPSTSSEDGGVRELGAGRYVLLATLGQGSQGTTWDAVDKREGRAVAIKAFDIRGARAWKDVELAEREARVLSSLVHPLLPRYLGHFEEDGTLYLVMEKVVGTPLSVLRKSGTRLSESEIVRLLDDANQVLTYLHGREPAVIHRDLKPSNVIRRPDGSFAFVDFGAVRERLRVEGGSTVVGTFGYMAPEQFQGRAGPASDVYAVGATALAMLTGKEPETLPHRGLAIDVSAALDPRTDPALRDVLTRMLEPDPDRRPVSIEPLLASVRPGRARRDEKRADHEERRARAREDAWASADRTRHARRVAREITRDARPEARDAWRNDRRLRLPFLLRLPIGVVLKLLQLVVVLVLHVALPFALVLLSLLFGRSLRRAARSVARSGGELVDSIVDARTQVREGWGPPAKSGVRAPPAAAPMSSGQTGPSTARSARVRYRPDPAADVEVEDPESDHEDGPERSRKSRRL